MHVPRAKKAHPSFPLTQEGTLVGIAPEPKRDAESLRGSRRSNRRLPRRAAVGRRSFTSTLKALDELAATGARVSVRITDLDRGTTVLAGDDFDTPDVARAVRETFAGAAQVVGKCWIVIT